MGMRSDAWDETSFTGTGLMCVNEGTAINLFQLLVRNLCTSRADPSGLLLAHPRTTVLPSELKGAKFGIKR